MLSKGPARKGKNVAGRRRDIVLPNDACPECGTRMIQKVSKLHHLVNGEKIMVPHVRHRSCPECGESLVNIRELHDMRLRAFDIYRGKYGLLSSDEIRLIREHAGVTQADFTADMSGDQAVVSRDEPQR